MFSLSNLDAALQSPVVDRLCAPLGHLPTWVMDGTGLRFLLTGMLTSLAAQALTRVMGHHAPAPVALRHAVAAGVRRLWMAAAPHLVRGSRGVAAWYAGWLDAHEMPQTAARVRTINGVVQAA